MNVTPTAIAGNVKLRAWSSFRKFSFRSLTLGLTLSVVSYLVLVPLFMLLYASVKSTEDKLPFEVDGHHVVQLRRGADQPGDAADLSQHDAIHRRRRWPSDCRWRFYWLGYWNARRFRARLDCQL